MMPDDSRFSRTRLALGDEAFRKLAGSRIAVIGLGAVGGFAAEALARSGVGHLCLVDVDCIQRTDINRQIIALESTLGRPKVEVMAERIRDINPAAHVDPRRAFFNRETAVTLLSDHPDYVVDAIDAVGPKLDLITYCHRNGIPLISVLGAAFKTDQTRIEVTDISLTDTCPLARVIRRRLRRNGIRSGVQVVFSREPGPPFLHPWEIETPELSTVTHRGRPRRVLGSLCPLAAVFGLLAAHVVLMDITGFSQTSKKDRSGYPKPVD